MALPAAAHHRHRTTQLHRDLGPLRVLEPIVGSAQEGDGFGPRTHPTPRREILILRREEATDRARVPVVPGAVVLGDESPDLRGQRRLTLGIEIPMNRLSSGAPPPARGYWVGASTSSPVTVWAAESTGTKMTSMRILSRSSGRSGTPPRRYRRIVSAGRTAGGASKR
jgi:hypothetical protein